MLTLAILIMLAGPATTTDASADTSVYRSEQRIVGVDWPRRITGAIHSGVTPAMLSQLFDDEPANTSLWKNRLSCGITTPFAQFAVPLKAGRTVKTRRFTFEETAGEDGSRHFTVYGAKRVKLMAYDYAPHTGITSFDLLNIESGAVTQHYKLESGRAFLSHCEW